MSSVAAMEVKLCPAPTGFTVFPDSLASVTIWAIFRASDGDSTRLGAHETVRPQLCQRCPVD